MVKPMFAPILAMIGGFVLAFGMFVGGLLFAVFVFFDNEPAHAPVQTASISDLWAAEPRAVKTDAQELERVAPKADRTNAGEPVEGQAEVAEPAIDTMTTGAVPAVAEEPTADEAVDNPAAARLLQAHQDWCARRYRSYDARTNSYSPYAGGRRDCFSPYVAEYAALTGAETPSDPHVRFAPLADEESSGVIEAAASEGETFAVEQDGFVVEDASGYAVIDDQHVRNCFSRYQSYRPEDNTYQPHGGGPRRVCE